MILISITCIFLPWLLGRVLCNVHVIYNLPFIGGLVVTPPPPSFSFPWFMCASPLLVSWFCIIINLVCIIMWWWELSMLVCIGYAFSMHLVTVLHLKMMLNFKFLQWNDPFIHSSSSCQPQLMLLLTIKYITSQSLLTIRELVHIEQTIA